MKIIGQTLQEQIIHYPVAVLTKMSNMRLFAVLYKYDPLSIPSNLPGSKGESSHNVMANLFKVYLAALDKEFNTYMKQKMN